MCFGRFDEVRSWNAFWFAHAPRQSFRLVVRHKTRVDGPWSGYMMSKMWLYLIMNSRLGRPGKLKLSSVSL